MSEQPKLDVRGLKRTTYAIVKAGELAELRKPLPVTLPTASKPLSDMDRREYENHRSATMKALVGRKK